MRRKVMKKFSLSRETLRHLSERQLTSVAGGDIRSDVHLCVTDSCDIGACYSAFGDTCAFNSKCLCLPITQ